MSDMNPIKVVNNVIRKESIPSQYRDYYDSVAKLGGNPKTIDIDLEKGLFADYIKKEVENGKLEKKDYVKITGFCYLDRNALSDVLSGKKVDISSIITR